MANNITIVQDDSELYDMNIWFRDIPYVWNDLVKFDGATYVSQIDNNINNNPVGSPYWLRID